jgi:carboxymethylenebutenolidase
MATIDRATFVTGSAAAIAAGATPADAQTDGFGIPHPPIVPENDPALTIVRTTLPRPDATIGAYVAMPKTTSATTPGIVMAAHVWGVDAQYRDLARRFAKLGYIVIAPGIADRSHPPSGDGATDPAPFLPGFTALFSSGTVTGDLLAGHDWIRERAPRAKIGLYGNCGGGGMALQALAGNTNYAAAAIAYGFVRADRKNTEPPPPGAIDWAAQVSTPTIGFYGALDRSINVDDVQAAYGLMTGPHDVTIYPDAAHAFLDDTRASYRAVPAADAWAKMTHWFGEYLTTP